MFMILKLEGELKDKLFK